MGRLTFTLEIELPEELIKNVSELTLYGLQDAFDINPVFGGREDCKWIKLEVARMDGDKLLTFKRFENGE